MIDEFFNDGPAYIPAYWELIINTLDTSSKFRVRTASFASFVNLEVESLPFGPRYYKGVQYPETLEVEIEERNDFSSFNFLQEEMNRVYNYSERKFRVLSGEDVFPDATLTLYRGTADGTYVEVGSFTFLNLRITSIGDLSFDQAASDLLTYSVSFSVEEVIPSTLENVSS